MKKALFYIVIIILFIMCYSFSFAKNLIIVIDDIENNSKIEKYNWYSKAIYSSIETDLNRISNVSIVDRKNTDKAINELLLATSEFSKNKNKMKLGQFIGANTILKGEYNIFDDIIEIHIKLIDVESLELINSVKVNGKLSNFIEIKDSIVKELLSNMEKVKIDKLFVNDANKYKINIKAYELYINAYIEFNNYKINNATKLIKESLKIDPNYFEANLLLANIYMIDNNYKKANDKLTEMLIIFKDISKYQYSLLLQDSALTNNYLGNYKLALSFYEMALKLKTDIYDNEHLSISYIYNDMATVYENILQYKKAFSLYKKALNIRKKLLHKNHYLIAEIYNNIAILYNKLGKYQKALKYHKKALKIRIKNFTKKHSSTADSYDNIGVTYSYQENYKTALTYFLKAYKIRNELKLPLSFSLNNIGTAYLNLLDYKKALNYFLKAENEKNDDITYMIGLTYNISYTNFKLNNIDESKLYLNKAKIMSKNVLDSNHPLMINIIELEKELKEK